MKYIITLDNNDNKLKIKEEYPNSILISYNKKDYDYMFNQGNIRNNVKDYYEFLIRVTENKNTTFVLGETHIILNLYTFLFANIFDIPVINREEYKYFDFAISLDNIEYKRNEEKIEAILSKKEKSKILSDRWEILFENNKLTNFGKIFLRK
ncbi:hypothetical protein SAMN02745164_02275 [Marinitoga hydrogenitolerans DSM 16785]|uniref:Uncharacterized protein n=1 Tax=Marinitoga hydrogenitolerans (strain DSM 16785 / JCM 12826 / AT1271) TaxID=1122195 RepID=A0A1M5AVF6_MARH1|nr:hypothetical protein [Marinitoga hydrogenitolerans]SHF34239.1 hypothetical protein SAMN02745164_02275 [Marinitoga hydrogenitolerans DSM 16785]